MLLCVFVCVCVDEFFESDKWFQSENLYNLKELWGFCLKKRYRNHIKSLNFIFGGGLFNGFSTFLFIYYYYYFFSVQDLIFIIVKWNLDFYVFIVILQWHDNEDWSWSLVIENMPLFLQDFCFVFCEFWFILLEFMVVLWFKITSLHKSLQRAVPSEFKWDDGFVLSFFFIF